MPASYLIANIEKRVAENVKALEIKPLKGLKVFQEQGKRFYTTPGRTNDNKQVLFKMLISRRREDASRLKKEITISRALNKAAPKRRGLNTIPLLKANAKKYPYWLLRKYLPGPIIGFHFKIFNIGLKKTVREQIADNVLAFQQIPCEKLANTLKQKKPSEYLKIIKGFEDHLKRIQKSKVINIRAFYSFFEKQKAQLADNLVLSHGDLTLANFFVNKGRVYLTDWELAKIDNLAADMARLWIQTYQYPHWRRALVLRFLSHLAENKKENFKQAFRIIAATEAFSELTCNLISSSPNPQLQNAAQKTIQLAKKGFDNVINQ